MGGHAWNHYLYTPRISKELYLIVRAQTTKALQKLFAHVVVPTEMPSKNDYGDVDFLVAGPLTSSTSTFDYTHHVTAIKRAFNTPHGRKGYLTECIMYFAIPAPGREDEFWIQIDVKVSERPELFEWEKVQLNYASGAKMIGSMIKPLGLTIGPEGCYVRVEGLEKVNFEKSLVRVTREPKEVLRIVGLDKRILSAGFQKNEDIFEYFAGSWLFNPAHFAERMKDEGYIRHLHERSAPYGAFVKEWIPEHYPGYVFADAQPSDLNKWYHDMRIAVREKVLTMYPDVAREYYEKRRGHVKEVEEHRLRELIMSAIPIGVEGWSDDLPQPPIIIRPSGPQTPGQEATNPLDMIVIDTPRTLSTATVSSSPGKSSDASIATSSTSPTSSVHSDSLTFSIPDPTSSTSPATTPLFVDALPRTPPQTYIPRPPPQTMSVEAKLQCLYRWTLFDPLGNPHLACEPREKNFTMSWTDSGAEDDVLVQWAMEMWWPVWTRQFRVNYVGMWKKRMEKEDRKVEEKVRVESEQREREARKEKVAWRLMRLGFGVGVAVVGE